MKNADYLTKPFDLGELEARIHALIRRCYGGFTHRIEVGRLVLDTQTHQVLADGQTLDLPIRKIAILEVLLLKFRGSFLTQITLYVIDLLSLQPESFRVKLQGLNKKAIYVLLNGIHHQSEGITE